MSYTQFAEGLTNVTRSSMQRSTLWHRTPVISGENDARTTSVNSLNFASEILVQNALSANFCYSVTQGSLYTIPEAAKDKQLVACHCHPLLVISHSPCAWCCHSGPSSSSNQLALRDCQHCDCQQALQGCPEQTADYVYQGLVPILNPTGPACT